MKIFFLLSDTNVGLVIGGAFTLGTLVLGFLAKAIIKPFLDKILDKAEKIHKEVNGMKTELVKTTEELGILKGIQQGRAQIRQEQRDLEDLIKRDANIKEIDQLKKDIEEIKNPKPLAS